MTARNAAEAPHWLREAMVDATVKAATGSFVSCPHAAYARPRRITPLRRRVDCEPCAATFEKDDAPDLQRRCDRCGSFDSLRWYYGAAASDAWTLVAFTLCDSCLPEAQIPTGKG